MRDTKKRKREIERIFKDLKQRTTLSPPPSSPRRRESRMDEKGTNPPFAFTPCHSEHSEESLKSFPRRRESRGEGRGKSWQSFPHHGNHASKPPPFAFTPCHSEHPHPVIPKRSEESPPFAMRKGARGMHQHVIPAQAGIQSGRDGKNHGNHYPIMAIMVQNLPQSPANSGRISLMITSCASRSMPV